MSREIATALSTLVVIKLKASFWGTIAERQRKIITLILEDFENKLTISKWAKITKCSIVYRDSLDLIAMGILIKNHESRRSTSSSLLISGHPKV